MDWQHYCWTTQEKGVIDYQHVIDDVIHHKWVKKCERCGYEDVRNYEPEELAAIRKEKEKQEKIKELKKQLKELEGK